MKYGSHPMPDSAEMNFSFGHFRKIPLNSSTATVDMFVDGASATKISAPTPRPPSADTSALPETMWISAGRPVSLIASHTGAHAGSGKPGTPSTEAGEDGSEMHFKPFEETRRISSPDA